MAKVQAFWQLIWSRGREIQRLEGEGRVSEIDIGMCTMEQTRHKQKKGEEERHSVSNGVGRFVELKLGATAPDIDRGRLFDSIKPRCDVHRPSRGMECWISSAQLI